MQRTARLASSTPTTESTYEPIPPQPVHSARARQAPGRTGRQERRVQVVHRRGGAGVLAVAGRRRPARSRHRQATGSLVTAGRTPGARPEHPDRNAGVVHPLLPHRQHAGSRGPSRSGSRPGQARFEQFVEQLGRHLLRGRSLVRDVVEELHPDPMRMDDAAALAEARERAS